MPTLVPGRQMEKGEDRAGGRKEGSSLPLAKAPAVPQHEP